MIHYYIGPSGLIFDIRMHFAAGRCPTAQIHADFQPANIKAHHKDSIIRMAESQTYLSPGDIATAEGRTHISPWATPVG